jgi:hypothetical protein
MTQSMNAPTKHPRSCQGIQHASRSIVGCCLAFTLGMVGQPRSAQAVPPLDAVEVYANDFNGPVGSKYAEWKSSPIVFTKTVTGGTGSLAAPELATIESPNHAQRFLGELGGPPIGRPGDADWNHTRVEQAAILSLTMLPPHTGIIISFDVYILRSWDGNSPAYGPDQFIIKLDDDRIIMNTTFSNNPKVAEDGSDQCFPIMNGELAHNRPWVDAAATGTLGYNKFFAEGIYRISLPIAHSGQNLTIRFGSSLFEGKGTKDEGWGLDNVSVVATSKAIQGQKQARPKN